ncbi:MAG: hypothetical protein DKM50_01090 [Candidatus Margulisiibacteriota bacterium]|nr:MAG: hypothetical protein A2X43_08185 [Candidatus Margulisbacteria bacterium GWD2_39_127]OGI01647.1 MAG: hypothetical protein A2X42_04800 [Candidatus Margulisbacteria bacterium GWF2_38_17]OGI06905.1 MAG: hypothetical protein A2X41_10505 [Candidatus Margulisbacteria bacterium GWE2_39_32]PZM83867.1 MAG: hypothetical protein DKM50_01090 [Candidatus Margulisiibacteriota bacterium]HAR63610.1 hypothetical protein [Candidatus Margulisiibacteriota bacterium]
MKKKFLSTLCSTCENVAATLDYHDALNSLVKNSAECLDAKACSLRLLDKTGKTLEIAATYGLSQAYIEKGPIEVIKSPLDKEVLEDRVVQVRDVTNDSRIPYPEEMKKEGIRSILSIPLTFQDRLLGLLRIYSQSERVFSEDDIIIIRTFASQGGAVINNAKRYARLKSINELGKIITSQLDIQKVLNTICQSAADAMNAKGISLQLVNNDTGKLEDAASFGLSEDFKQKTTVENDEFIKECLKGNDVIIEKAKEDQRVPYPAELEKEGIQSSICLPLKLKNRVIGTLRIFTAYSYKSEKEDLEFLAILCDFGIVAIENARLYTHVKRDYEDLQKDVWKWYDWGERQPQI